MNNNPICAAFLVVSFIATLFLAIGHEWSLWITLLGALFVNLYWLWLNLWQHDARQQAVEARDRYKDIVFSRTASDSPPTVSTPANAFSATLSVLDYVFPDADSRAVIKKDLARAAEESGSHAYAQLLEKDLEAAGRDGADR
jgi:hypothetical protein